MRVEAAVVSFIRQHLNPTLRSQRHNRQFQRGLDSMLAAKSVHRSFNGCSTSSLRRLVLLCYNELGLLDG